MDKVDRAWRIFENLMYQYPFWPSTFSPCVCGRKLARGVGKCAQCYTEELAELVGPELAQKALENIDNLRFVWSEIKDKVEE